MRIAILTLPLHGNYGGIMQNYALQTALCKLGHDVETINLKKELLFKRYDISCLKRFFPFGSSDSKHLVRRFIDEHIRLTVPVYNKRDLLKHDFTSYDAVIVGSDQVWRIQYAYPDIYSYYLDFVPEKNTRGERIRKIAFSASFGTDEAEYTVEQIWLCGAYLKDFDWVTVREDSALSLIHNVYQWSCKHPPVVTLDPTMLLGKEDYIRLFARHHKTENEGGLFYYVLDMNEEKRELIQRIASDLGVKSFTVARKSHRWYDSLENRMIPSPVEWLQAFCEASFVFTDSFHGSVFSILFNKNFLVMGNKKRGLSRFHSLLQRFNLMDRLIYAGEEYYAYLCRPSIDWDAVNAVLAAEKKNMQACFELW